MMLRKYAHEGDLEVAEARVLELLRFFGGVLERQERNVVSAAAATHQCTSSATHSAPPTCAGLWVRRC